MAERRMFAKTIIDSDAFLDMPLSTQALYFHLAMRADDEGFVSNPKKIQKMIGASDDDCKLLILKRYILTFESGIVVIKHWKIHNYIQSDRFKETTYLEEKAMLRLDGKKAYTECIQNGYNLDTQVSIGKNSLEIGKVSGERGEPLPTSKRFIPPTLEEITAYCRERKNNVNPQKFLDHYTTVGWKRGKTPIKDWKACVRLWENDEKGKKGTASGKYNRED